MHRASVEVNLDSLRRRFLTFADKECVPASPLYAHLSRGVAQDDDLLALAACARPGQPPPNMLFGAAQYLLLSGNRHPLAGFYPTLTAQPRSLNEADPFPLFREFCLSRRADLEAVLAARLVQTNEVRRCACLLPAFARVQALAFGRPLALLEVGASAGLNLLWDWYCYEYGELSWGEAEAGVRLTCQLRGELRPSLPAWPVVINWRLGLDLNPIDAQNADDVRWLRALIWSEQTERVALLEQAIAVARLARPTLWRGDALTLLPTALTQVPADAALCVYHSFTLNQFTPAARQQFTALLAAEAAQRPLFRLSYEWATDSALLQLSTFTSGGEHITTLARCDPHGGWIQWLAADEV
jgi:hypothetical protein